MNSFGTLFHDKIFFPDMSLTVNNMPDISRFSRQVVTLNIYASAMHNLTTLSAWYVDIISSFYRPVCLPSYPRSQHNFTTGIRRKDTLSAGWSTHAHKKFDFNSPQTPRLEIVA